MKFLNTTEICCNLPNKCFNRKPHIHFAFTLINVDVYILALDHAILPVIFYTPAGGQSPPAGVS